MRRSPTSGASAAPTRSLAPRAALLGGVAAAAALVAGVVILRPNVGGDAGGRAATTAASAQAGLCATLDAATDGDMAAARTIFYDQAHDGLHTLAAQAFQVDSAAAARLLEAKYPVEALFAGSLTPTELTAALDLLSDATVAAARAVGEPGVERCG